LIYDLNLKINKRKPELKGVVMDEMTPIDDINNLPNVTKRRDFLKNVVKITSGVMLLGPAGKLLNASNIISPEKNNSVAPKSVQDSDPFLGEIMMISFNFAPKGWALCNGQLLPINENQALFSLLGTNYGGDGRVNFGLPDLQGRIPIHMGNGHVLGERGGEQAHTLNISEIPTHTHLLQCSSNAGDTLNPTNNYPAKNAVTTSQYGNLNLTAMNAASITQFVGGSQAHLNMMPFLTLNFIIALEGIYPSQT
jgi:microcystin-dependent protein